MLAEDLLEHKISHSLLQNTILFFLIAYWESMLENNLFQLSQR